MSYWEAVRYIIPRLPRALWGLLRTPYFVPTIIRVVRAYDDQTNVGHLAVLEDTVKRHPKDVGFRAELIRTYMAEEDYQKALDHAQTSASVRNKPGPLVFYYMAACHYHLSDWDACLANGEAFLGRVKNRHRESMTDEIKWTQNIIRYIEEENKDLFQLREALEYFKKNAFKVAIPLFEKTYERHQNTSCLYYLGICQSQLGDYSKAQEYAEKYLAELDDIGREVHSDGVKWAREYVDWYNEHYSATE